MTLTLTVSRTIMTLLDFGMCACSRLGSRLLESSICCGKCMGVVAPLGPEPVWGYRPHWFQAIAKAWFVSCSCLWLTVAMACAGFVQCFSGSFAGLVQCLGEGLAPTSTTTPVWWWAKIGCSYNLAAATKSKTKKHETKS